MYSSGETWYFLCFPPRIIWVSNTKYCGEMDRKWDASALICESRTRTGLRASAGTINYFWEMGRCRKTGHTNNPGVRLVQLKISCDLLLTACSALCAAAVCSTGWRDGSQHLLRMPKAHREVAVKRKPTTVKWCIIEIKGHRGIKVALFSLTTGIRLLRPGIACCIIYTHLTISPLWWWFRFISIGDFNSVFHSKKKKSAAEKNFLLPKCTY